MMDNYADASSKIDEMSALQKIRPMLYNTKNQITLSNVQRAMATVDKAIKAPGYNEFQHLSPESLNSLWALRDDLRRVASSEEKARILGGGSESSQNIVDLLKGGAGMAVDLAGHGAATAAFGPGVGSLVYMGGKSVVTNKMSQRQAKKTAIQSKNMLYPDPARYRPLNSPD